RRVCENVARQRRIGCWGRKLSRGSREIECAERLVEINSPALRADNPRNRNSSAVRRKLIAALAAAHLVRHAATIELWSAFAESEQRRISGEKAHHAGIRIQREL